jgi:regulation of enolase protein 1 (concanavalin A-like superfamily)
MRPVGRSLVVCTLAVCTAAFISSFGASQAQSTLTPGPGTVVIWTASIPTGDLHGDWLRVSDATAAGGAALHNPNRSRSKVTPALASPTNYFEVRFDAAAGGPYWLWVRMRAENNAYANDSVHVQFSDSVDSANRPTARIGTTSSEELILQNGAGSAKPQGWGWTDNGYDSAAEPIYFASSGTHLLRVQQREDGAIVDQIVLSRDTYVSTPPGARLNDTTILPTASPSPGLPDGQQNRYIGSPSLAGSATYQNGTYSVVGAGADVWGASDQFHFVYRQFTGDGEILARVATVQGIHEWSKAGVMFRESLTAGSRHAFTLVTPGKGYAFQRRLAPSGSSSSTSGGSGTAPGWVRLVRRGDTFSSYRSSDGRNWTSIGSDQILMGPTVYAGLAVTSHDVTQRTTATFSNLSVLNGTTSNQPPTVTLTAPANGTTFTAPATIALTASASDPENRLARVEFYSGTTLLGSDTTAPYTFSWSSVPAGSYTLKAIAHDGDGASAMSATIDVTVSATPPAGLPDGQQNRDIGSPAILGSTQYSNGRYTVTGAGADIWGTTDQFHFVYRQVTGDVDIVARVASLQGTNGWSKAGVMVRESLNGNSRHALAHITAGNGYRMIRRVDTSGGSSSTACRSGTAPGWVRLVRRANTFEMHHSVDGQAWSACGATQIAMSQTVYVGLAVSSVDATGIATAVFDNLRVTAGSSVNELPTVSVTAPASGATFTAPATITITASASDPENRMARVDFFSGSTLLASDLTAPYSFTWSGVGAGSYLLSARAVDQDGGSRTSSTVSVTVNGTATSPRTWMVMFTAAADHDTNVTSYLLEVFTSGANPSTAASLATSDLGKPALNANREISVDRSSFFNALAAGNYIATVSAIGPGGRTRSAAYSFTR